MVASSLRARGGKSKNSGGEGGGEDLKEYLVAMEIVTSILDHVTTIFHLLKQ
jgi:hypothetical protein